ncbi:MAG: aldo/keto reductase [Bacilli bacterium]|nr:aldo/keto reductase [Bacilli bacterium]MDD4056346.1 aldo/keto reductase [Bacilli bacterium]MDY0209053.1 aldo/keto reductase [Bacilli bacterium]
MDKRKLGKTELMVSEIGLGGIPIQRTTQEEAIHIVDELINKGINFIDTARGYTCSEAYFGRALQGRRENFILCTKSMSRSYEDMKKDIETSLEQLQTDYIDIYQLHNVKTEQEYAEVMGNSGAYKALVEAKAMGKIGYIGITSHSLDFLEKIIDTCPFHTIQFPYNVIETKAENLFKRAIRKNIGVIVMKPLAGGAIEQGKTALKFILNTDFISVVIPGMASVSEVKENASVVKGELSENEIEYIKHVRRALDNDFCRRCGYCMPCPQGIDIPSCFVLEGYFDRYGLASWAQDRYEKMNHFASECINCRLCVDKCPYGLEIPTKLKRVKRIFGK